MRKVRQAEIPWVERKSPRGKYHRFGADIAGALESSRAGPGLPGRPPFEVELVRLPPGAANFPFHSHSAEWECYVILSGSGTMRAGTEQVDLGTGDCAMCPPGEAHQLLNTGEADLLYYVIANNAPAGVWHYPDSGKWGFVGPQGDLYFRVQEIDYFDREE